MACFSLCLLASATVTTVAPAINGFPSGNDRPPGSPVRPFCERFAWNATISPWFGSKEKWSAHNGLTLGGHPARDLSGDERVEGHDGAQLDPHDHLVRPVRMDTLVEL